ncbi:phage tail assembly chaperone GT [Sporosarcina sp. NCCP-2331]
MSEIMDSPLYYLIEVLAEKNKPKQQQSLIAAFGG